MTPAAAVQMFGGAAVKDANFKRVCQFITLDCSKRSRLKRAELLQKVINKREEYIYT
jgi:hypothetical protein